MTLPFCSITPSDERSAACLFCRNQNSARMAPSMVGGAVDCFAMAGTIGFFVAFELL
jgi:hypothetical protein